MIKIMLLLHRRPDLSVEEFRRYWHTEHQALLVRLPGLRRLVLNDVLPGLRRCSWSVRWNCRGLV